MPVDERTLVAEVAGWVTAILTRRQDLPYGPARVEEHGVGNRKRHDFVLYRRGANRVVLTGEVKMPENPEGKSPFHQSRVEDAFTKASRAGTSYYFTWNVREFVLFETHREGVPFMERRVEGPIQVADITTSDIVQPNRIRTLYPQILVSPLPCDTMVSERRRGEASFFSPQMGYGWLKAWLVSPG